MTRLLSTNSLLLILLLVFGVSVVPAIGQLRPADEPDTNTDAPEVNNGSQDADQEDPSEAKDPEKKKEEDTPPPRQKILGMDPNMALMLLLLGGFVVLYVIMGRGRRKQQQKRKEMLESLKKGDKVITIGGIQGTVMEVKGNEITVKVDETNNIRMKFARWSVQSVGEEPAEQSPHEQR
jgi:preprotein translocase subunit YajC